MRKAVLLIVALAAVGSLHRAWLQGTHPLEIHFIDVEGGQATLFVSPSGESMLVDAGHSGFDGRDGRRIAAAARKAGVSQIDYMVVTHYHGDHVGGVPELSARLPIRTFVDHGRAMEQGNPSQALFSAYAQARSKGRHLPVRPGDSIPIRDFEVRVVAANGELLSQPLPGGGEPNPLCRDFVPRDPDPTENARSIGMMITYGTFRMLNLGDLTWNLEHELVCPINLFGTVDVYLTTHHGLASSGPTVLVHAVRPRVAVMNNGATKGGARDAWRIIRDSPGLEDFWQLHYALKSGDDHNTGQRFIANLDESTAHSIRISVYPDGGFVVLNERNGYSRTYDRRQ